MITNKPLVTKTIILVYTMTNGLGDYLIMGDVMRKAKILLPQAQCFMVHRANPHVNQWPYGAYKDTFFNVYSPVEMLRLVGILSAWRRKGYIVFGLQMSPGSLQGFALHRCLKTLGAMDYIVDFNLINADIVTLAQGDYILDRQMNQLRDLFKINVPEEHYHLNLPLSSLDHQPPVVIKTLGQRLIGIHPWSRRGSDSFFWPLDKWVDVIRHLLRYENIDFVIFGRDQQFGSFTSSLRSAFKDSLSRFHFVPSTSVICLVKTIADLDVVLTVNTVVVPLGYAFTKKMVVLTGPNLDLWNPQGENIRWVTDTQALLKGADRPTRDQCMPQVARIKVQQVLDAVDFFCRQP